MKTDIWNILKRSRIEFGIVKGLIIRNDISDIFIKTNEENGEHYLAPNNVFECNIAIFSHNGQWIIENTDNGETLKIPNEKIS